MMLVFLGVKTSSKQILLSLQKLRKQTNCSDTFKTVQFHTRQGNSLRPKIDTKCTGKSKLTTKPIRNTLLTNTIEHDTVE